MNEQSLKTSSLKLPITLSALALLGLIIYSNSFHGEFCSDDNLTILQNPFIRDLSNISGIWHSFNTRFLVGLSLALNYRLGYLDPVGYHLVNVFWHVLASFLVYGLVFLTFRIPKMKTHTLQERSWLVAFLTSLIFLCHPAQTESVAYITQRSTSMASVFYLATLVGFIKARLEVSRSKSNLFALMAIVSMVLGMFSKEMTVTLPLMLLVYEFFFFGTDNRRVQIKFFSILVLLAAIVPFALNQEQPGSV